MANLRIELKRLRAGAKQGLGGGGDEVKEEKKAEEKKQPPAKDGKKDKNAKEEQKADETPSDEITASEAELDAIRHVYVNMLLQSTKNP